MTDAASPFVKADYPHVETPPANADLADAIRELVDATVRTVVTADVVAEATATVRSLTAQLRAVQMQGPRNITAVKQGMLDDAGNPAVGDRNPIAPPLTMEYSHDAGKVWSDFSLGAPYEGPPGCVHGGVVALVLDQVMGTVPWVAGHPGMTAYLNITYRRPTPLNQQLRCEGWVQRTEGFKTFVGAKIVGPDGETTVEAEGLFVTPRAARSAGALPHTDSGVIK